jgi:hypothetical protein
MIATCEKWPGGPVPQHGKLFRKVALRKEIKDGEDICIKLE